MFITRTIGRATFPTKHVLICEDSLNCQSRVLEHLSDIFQPQGTVQFSVVPGTAAAAAIIASVNIDLIILDFDMPEGNGADLMNWLKFNNKKIPIITFSGGHHNNDNMMAMGADYKFHKEEVINGQADDLIKSILQFNTGLAEDYQNLVCWDKPMCKRYWVLPNLMVGGSIIDQSDWHHLQNAFGVSAVINAETEHMDFGKGIANLLEVRVHDDGTKFPPEYIIMAIEFAKQHKDKTLYVHCQMGASRSPAYTYAILRGVYGMTPEQALQKLHETIPGPHKYGWHPNHQSYMSRIEEVLAGMK